MADEGTQYSSRYEEPTPDGALEELDWASPEGPPVEEAAALMKANANAGTAASAATSPPVTIQRFMS